MTGNGYVGKSDVGLKRKNNEDAYLSSPELRICVVADGMGGAAAGELASHMFAETALDVFSGGTDRSEQGTLELVQKTFLSTNELILEHVRDTPHHKGMGCTAELLALSDSGFVIGHVGDSRTYRLRNGQLQQLTQDHSLVQNQIEQGLTSLEESKKDPRRHIILRAVGVDERLPLDIIRGRTFPLDLFLLCTDGLTDMVEDLLIKEVLSSDLDLSQKADHLIRWAKRGGGKDNITVVLHEVESL
jgi:PPM family protein phosphatase